MSKRGGEGVDGGLGGESSTAWFAERAESLPAFMPDEVDRISEMCRLCFSFRSDLQSLLDPEGKQNSLAIMLHSFSAVELSFGEGLPESVCHDCVHLIKKCSGFKELCERSESVLRSCQSMKMDDLVMNTSRKCDLNGILQKSPPYDKSENVMYSCEIYSEDSFQEHISSSIDENDSEPKDPFKKENRLARGGEQTGTVTKRVKLKLKLKKMPAGSNNNVTKGKFCGVCGKKFRYLSRLVRHELMHRPDKLHHCQICKKGFNDIRHYKAHVKRHEENSGTADRAKVYACSQCETKFSSEGDLLVHSSIHVPKGDKYICRVCNKEFKTSLQLKRHVRTHLSDKPHKCSICKMGFSEMGSLTRHFRKHTGETRERKHTCEICSKAYFDSHSLKIHQRTHTGEKPWECKDCGKCFIDCRLLKSHRKVHVDDKPFKCNMCDKRFRHISTLTTHKRTHTGEKPYICTVCGNSFVQSSNLTLHMRTHTRERPYSCKLCGKKFSSSSARVLHMRIHTGEKPYSCPICSKRFARMDMKAHMRIHTGEKPYNCNICNHSFTSLAQLQLHVRVHTGERPFVCTLCGKACTTAFYLKKHIIKMHNKKHVVGSLSSNSDSYVKIEILPLHYGQKEMKSVDGYDPSSVQILNIPEGTLMGTDMSVVDGDSSVDLGLSSESITIPDDYKSSDEHEIVTAVETIVTDGVVDDKMYEIDPGLLKLHESNIVRSE